MTENNKPFIAFHPSFSHHLPEGHRFPMIKYELLPQQLLREGVVTQEDFYSPDPIDFDTICRAHDPDYVQHFINLDLDPKMVRRIGFPQNKALVNRELRLANGTVQVALVALERGIGLNIAGGTHHAGYDYGEGFCMLNDQAIAAQYLLDHEKAKQILIVDLDVHQGNGTAQIFKNESRVFTFSMHGEKNFPFIKEQSDLDIGLPDHTSGKEYLRILQNTLPDLINNVRPDFVFYQSGVDILETDRLGKMDVTPEECRQRDIFVFDQLKEHNLPAEVSVGGGYSKQISYIVNAHCNTYKEGIKRLLR